MHTYVRYLLDFSWNRVYTAAGAATVITWSQGPWSYPGEGLNITTAREEGGWPKPLPNHHDNGKTASFLFNLPESMFSLV